MKVNGIVVKAFTYNTIDNRLKALTDYALTFHTLFVEYYPGVFFKMQVNILDIYFKEQNYFFFLTFKGLIFYCSTGLFSISNE